MRTDVVPITSSPIGEESNITQYPIRKPLVYSPCRTGHVTLLSPETIISTVDIKEKCGWLVGELIRGEGTSYAVGRQSRKRPAPGVYR